MNLEMRQDSDLVKEQADAQRELQEWSAKAQCAAIDALSPQQVHSSRASRVFHRLKFCFV